MAAQPSDFYERVWQLVCQIPSGRVSTYGHLAAHLGTRGSARVVGYAMNASHSAPFTVPAHRVVNRQGLLTGKHHFANPDLMQQLLESEGVQVENDKVVHFKQLLWVPNAV